MTGKSPAIAMGTPVGGAGDVEATRLERQKTLSRFLDGGAGLLLFGSGISGIIEDHTPNPLERVVFFWLALLGLLIVLAEVGVSFVTKRIEVLQHRSGRAGLTLLAATLCGAAAPRQYEGQLNLEIRHHQPPQLEYHHYEQHPQNRHHN